MRSNICHSRCCLFFFFLELKNVIPSVLDVCPASLSSPIAPTFSDISSYLISTGTSSEQKHWNKERNWNFAVINVIKEQNLKHVTPLFPTYTSLKCFRLESAMKVKSQKAIASACIM